MYYKNKGKGCDYMITQLSDKIIAKFGTGTVSMLGDTLVGETDAIPGTLAILGLRNNEGEPYASNTYTEDDLYYDCPIVLTFSNTESIDALIAVLEDRKIKLQEALDEKID